MNCKNYKKIIDSLTGGVKQNALSLLSNQYQYLAINTTNTVEIQRCLDLVLNLFIVVPNIFRNKNFYSDSLVENGGMLTREQFKNFNFQLNNPINLIDLKSGDLSFSEENYYEFIENCMQNISQELFHGVNYNTSIFLNYNLDNSISFLQIDDGHQDFQLPKCKLSKKNTKSLYASTLKKSDLYDALTFTTTSIKHKNKNSFPLPEVKALSVDEFETKDGWLEIEDSWPGKNGVNYDPYAEFKDSQNM